MTHDNEQHAAKMRGNPGKYQATITTLPPRVQTVIKIAAGDNGTTPVAMLAKVRWKHVVAARTQAIKTLRRMGFSYPQIGRFLNLDHTTVMHNDRKQEATIPMPKVWRGEVPVPDFSGEWAI